jgi:flavin-dependent dehydrogenase
MSERKPIQHQIAIIGGGPAGTTAASFLSSAGFDVCLFERKNFPRDVLCGEFLSTEVIGKIKELELYSDFLSLNPNRIDSFNFISKSGKNISAGFDFEAFALRRSNFDKMLLDKCNQNGAMVYQPAEVNSIVRSNNNFNINARTDSGIINIEVKYVIASYGKQNRLDKILFRKFINNKSQLNGVKFHLNQNAFCNFKKNEIIIFSGSKIYCGLNKINGDKVTVCFLENRKIYDEPPRAKIIRNIKSNPALAEMFTNDFEQQIQSEQIYGTGNIYFGSKEKFKNGIFFIGDSAGLIAPLAGDGIAMAMESAKLAAEIIYDLKNHPRSLEKTGEIYENNWNELFQKRITSSLWVQKILMNSFLTSTGQLLTSAYPALLKHLIRITRNYPEIQNKY